MLVHDLGQLPYLEALDVQRETHERVIAGEQSPTLLLVEHDPVITLGRRAKREHVLADDATLLRLSIDVVETNRGGDVTYHGPGQLVAYPILRLNDLNLNVSSYMRLLEQVVIDTLAGFDIAAQRDACAVGVWIDSGKICAMGVRIRRNVSMHGLALNVCPDLSHFDTIIPCGLTGRCVTSLLQLLGNAAPTMDHVKAALVAAMQRSVGSE